jgi:hypothetical protein
MLDFFLNLFSEFLREKGHYTLFLGGNLNMENILSCFFDKVGLSICELLADLLFKLFSKSWREQTS